MELFLLEAAKAESDPKRYAVINELAKDDFLAEIPFLGVDNGGVDYMVEGDLPAVGFRGINETPDATYGILNPQYERLKILSTDIDVDPFLLETKGPEVKADQVRMKTRALGRRLAAQFINGNEAVDPRSFDGLRRRLPITSSQAIAQSGALSCARLLELTDAVDAGGEEKILVMNKAMRRRLTIGASNTAIGGFITRAQNEFGKMQTYFNDCRIVVTDVDEANNLVQPFTETDGVGSSTSIYCVAFGDLGVTAIQHKSGGGIAINIQEFGVIPEGPDRTRMEWYIGAAVFNGRTAARLYGITDAAITA